MTTHTNDCSTCDTRIAFIPGRDWPEGSLRPVYPAVLSYPRYVGDLEDAARPGAAAPDVGAFFREADAPGRRQYFPPDAADIVPVIPCVLLVLAAALGLLGDRPELGLVVEIVRDCAGFLDFEYDPREKAEQLRQYLAAASKALAGVAPDSWLALTRADAGPDRANVALSRARAARGL